MEAALASYSIRQAACDASLCVKLYTRPGVEKPVQLAAPTARRLCPRPRPVGQCSHSAGLQPQPHHHSLLVLTPAGPASRATGANS